MCILNWLSYFDSFGSLFFGVYCTQMTVMKVFGLLKSMFLQKKRGWFIICEVFCKNCKFLLNVFWFSEVMSSIAYVIWSFVQEIIKKAKIWGFYSFKLNLQRLTNVIPEDFQTSVAISQRMYESLRHSASSTANLYAFWGGKFLNYLDLDLSVSVKGKIFRGKWLKFYCV